MRLGELKRYEKYKDSGVEWIGEVPEGWEVKPLKYLTSMINRGISPTYVENSNISVINQACIYWDSFQLENLKYQQSDIPISKGKLVLGDVLINSTGTGTLGRAQVFNLDGEFISDSHVTIIRTFQHRLNPRFLFYLLQTPHYQGFIYSAIVTGATNQIELSREGLRNTGIINPTYEVQKTIVDFLDQKTTEIDSLIADKEKLIELLQEKRQAIISEAVTKGLDRNVKMKDSGIEWIGEVPEGWGVVPLRWLISIRSGDFINKDEINEEGKYPVIGGNGIMAYTEKINIDKPTIAIGRVGALCGNIHLINEKSWITDNALYLTEWQSKKIYLDYLRLFLEALNLNRFASQTAQPLITGELVKKQYIPLPSLEEQINICSYLKNYFTNLDELIQSIRFQISNLKEYRQSLISEAVTGKIMV